VALNLLDLKSFGERIASRDPDRQTAEVHIRIALMNRFNALGTAAEFCNMCNRPRRKGAFGASFGASSGADMCPAS